ncbi:M15 family metallopeptidase [Virgibacillus sp. YIM 98842]|uniref:M15 family metallopeptidase n=1 Tax=Virgibacillus sp. YIM 98842 TaxID=2663533 RepID=UPI0013DCD151|nr:M15 family metallopeptidase [Virgibacillus sp. YIM 98842]
MRILRRLVVLSFIILIFFAIRYVIYDEIGKRYVYLGRDAPLPEELHPKVEESKNALLKRAKEAGIHVVITATVRSMDEQDALYAQGRTEDGNIVTYAEAGESYHNYGLAIDYALEDMEGDIIWDIEYDGNDNGESDWFEVAEIAKELGFEWGGDWESFQDYPHLQMTFGLSVNQLQRGWRPRGTVD